MERKRRLLISSVAGVVALAATPQVRASSSPSTQHHRHLVGVGTAGSALVRQAVRKGLVPAVDLVRLVDRDANGERFRVRDLLVARAASNVDYDLMVVAALGGRDGARLAQALASHWSRERPLARRNAILIVPFEFEARRHADAQSQLRRLPQAFHEVTVLHNQHAVGDPAEAWAAVHARSNAAVFAALHGVPWSKRGAHDFEPAAATS